MLVSKRHGFRPFNHTGKSFKMLIKNKILSIVTVFAFLVASIGVMGDCRTGNQQVSLRVARQHVVECERRDNDEGDQP